MNLPSGNYLTHMAHGDSGQSLIAPPTTAAMPEPTLFRLRYLGTTGD
jgi:hypothetical protein